MFPGETILSQSEEQRKDPHNGPFKVMQSQGSGDYYIGSMFLACGDPSCGQCGEYSYGRKLTKGQELDYNSRETEYFTTKTAAENALETYEKEGILPKMRLG